jgi:hypothetical protein
MPEFKVGDRVRRIGGGCNGMCVGDTDVVSDIEDGHMSLKKYGAWHWGENLELVEPTPLERQLEDAEKQLVIANDSVHSLGERIKSLQQAIKERDKPKGRVKVGDAYEEHDLFLARSDGVVHTHHCRSTTPDYIAMGHVFYDIESAERFVHDRKQAVLSGNI